MPRLWCLNPSLLEDLDVKKEDGRKFRRIWWRVSDFRAQTRRYGRRYEIRLRVGYCPLLTDLILQMGYSFNKLLVVSRSDWESRTAGIPAEKPESGSALSHPFFWLRQAEQANRAVALGAWLLTVLPSDDIFSNKLELSRYDTMMQVWGRGRFTSTSGPGIG